MNFFTRVRIFVCLFLFVIVIFTKTECGLVEITSNNFESTVIDGGKDAWIVAIKNTGRVSLDEWKEAEYYLRGLSVRVGIIDPQKDGAFLKRKGFLQKDKTYPAARVYPYGGYKIKATGKTDVKTRQKAEKAALKSLPDETTKVTTMKEVEEYVKRGYYAKPIQMPVLLLTDKIVTSPLFRALALKYFKYFNFGVVHKPSKEIQQNLVVKELPTIIIIIATPSEAKGKITMSSIIYETKVHGEFSYLNLTRFMYAVHKKHWYDHPGAKNYKEDIGFEAFYFEEVKAVLGGDFENGGQGKKKGEREQKEFMKSESLATEITFENHKRMCRDYALGVCLVYFVNGNDNKQVQQALTLLKDVQGMSENEDKPLHYLWVDSSCHPEYGEIFGIFPDNIPVLLLAKPKQRLFKTLQGSVTKETVNQVVSNMFLGREDLSHYSRFNDMLPSVCDRESDKTTKGGKNDKDKKSTARKEKQQKNSDKRKVQRKEEL